MGRHPEPQREGLFARLAQSTLTGTVGEPEQLAAADLYLMQNDYVTGTVHTVDGGLPDRELVQVRPRPAALRLRYEFGGVTHYRRTGAVREREQGLREQRPPPLPSERLGRRRPRPIADHSLGG